MQRISKIRPIERLPVAIIYQSIESRKTKTKAIKIMAKKNITFEQNKENEKEKHLKPYCEKAAVALTAKDDADELRPLASAELQAMLDAKPETKDYTGTVVYICNGEAYKLRVQRPDNTDWMKKRLKDPNLKELKAVKKLIAKKEKRAKELVESLTADHPKCVSKGFVMAYLR